MSSSAWFFMLVACSCMLIASSRKMDSGREALIDAAIQETKREFAAKKNLDMSLSQKKLHAFKMATPEALAQGNANLRFERMINLAEKKIIEKERKATAQGTESLAESLALELLHRPGSILSKEEIAKIYEESGCGEEVHTPINCNMPVKQKHRTADGTCNNLNNPAFGAANTRLRRLIPSQYDNGISRPIGFLQNQGSSLFAGPFSPPNPSPRVASLGVITDRQVNDTMHTHIMMQWGQFMDHDLDAIPEFEDCPAGCEIEDEYKGSCYPFPVPLDDEEVSVTRAGDDVNGCHGFRRSLGVCPDLTEALTGVPPREQINAITHFIDGSMVYHHDPTVQSTLIRDPDSEAGLLRVGAPAPNTDRPLLPEFEPGSTNIACPNPPCFLAGDFRVNEQSSLTAMHTLWVREHNRIAQILKNNSPGLSSDEIFFTAREIVASEIQKITYKDYLPIILGDSFSELFPSYDTIGYDPTIDPSIPNAFATAAYRFGHSQIQPFFERLDENYESIPLGPLSLVDAFFDTSHIRTSGIAPFFRGLVAKPARLVDEFLNSILTNRLFADDADTPGMDLASLNIQRGRDHGLPKYLTWKQWAKTQCGLESDFRNQLTNIHLLQTYGSLDNVDLFVGGLAEEPLPGGLVGAVFACIFTKTFLGLRHGDRFYYENSDPKTALFSAEQRAEIEQASLSRVICDNTDIDSIQPNAFMVGQRVQCSQIPSMNLNVFMPLPEFCFIKVSSDTRVRLTALSRNLDGRRIHMHRRRVRANRNTCLRFRCSASTVTISTRRRCALHENSMLPGSQSSSPNIYAATLQAFISPDNGIYTSSRSCNAGAVVALENVCTHKETTSIEQEDDVEEVEKDIDTDKELGDLLPDEKEAIDLITGNTTPTEGKLIALMEKVLDELKTEEDKPGPVAKKEDSSEDSSLLSELEGLLGTLE